ncbi:hypothetical protein DFJ74DRAFT_644812 [Hyaloraphidium curvatum]|nr:hypothetical protein DFJ74DRAFT_644812 [Hyaloraphidium curvatum]
MERSYAGYPLKRSKLALRNGAHYVIHVVAADQWQVELAPLAEFIVPLLRGVTLDIFLVGPQIVVEPMAKGGGTAPVPIAEKGAEEKQQPATGDAVASAKETPVESMTAPQRAMLRRTQSSVELKSDKYESCVRVHVARSPYMYPPESSSFPIDKYPPDLVMTFGSVPNPGEERALDATRLMLRTCDFPARFVVNVDVNWLAALESREAVEVKRPKAVEAFAT